MLEVEKKKECCVAFREESKNVLEDQVVLLD